MRGIKKFGAGLVAAAAISTGVVVSTATQSQAHEARYGACIADSSNADLRVIAWKNPNGTWTYDWRQTSGYKIRIAAPDPYFKRVYTYNSWGQKFFTATGRVTYGGVVTQPSWGGLWNKSVYGVHIQQWRCSFSLPYGSFPHVH